MRPPRSSDQSKNLNLKDHTGDPPAPSDNYSLHPDVHCAENWELFRHLWHMKTRPNISVALGFSNNNQAITCENRERCDRKWRRGFKRLSETQRGWDIYCLRRRRRTERRKLLILQKTTMWLRRPLKRSELVIIQTVLHQPSLWPFAVQIQNAELTQHVMDTSRFQIKRRKIWFFSFFPPSWSESHFHPINISNWWIHRGTSQLGELLRLQSAGEIHPSALRQPFYTKLRSNKNSHDDGFYLKYGESAQRTATHEQIEKTQQ